MGGTITGDGWPVNTRKSPGTDAKVIVDLSGLLGDATVAETPEETDALEVSRSIHEEDPDLGPARLDHAGQQ